MRIIAFIQDKHSITDIMKAQGIQDSKAPPPIPKFIAPQEATDEIPSHAPLEPAPDGCGRVSRALACAILARDGKSYPLFLSLDEYLLGINASPLSGIRSTYNSLLDPSV